MDELREHQNLGHLGRGHQHDERPPRGQAWAFSNAGDNLSIVLRYLRAQVHKRLDWPDGDADKEVLGEDDPELEAFLAQYDARTRPASSSGPHHRSPAAPTSMLSLRRTRRMNHTDIVPELHHRRALLASLATTPPGSYDTEVRCIWVPMLGSGPLSGGILGGHPRRPLQAFREQLSGGLCLPCPNRAPRPTSPAPAGRGRRARRGYCRRPRRHGLDSFRG
jgi:hypothetical protein